MNFNSKELEKEREMLVSQRKKWREQRLITALHGFNDEKDPGKKARRRTLLAKEIAEQNSLLKKLMAVELES